MTDAPTPPNAPDAPVAPRTLPKRPLGRTGLEVTNLTLGTWGLAEQAYGPSTRADLEAVVDAALEEGIRAFDVAPLWGDGLAEEVVGAKVRERRDDVVVISRAGAVRKGDAIVRMFDPPSIEGSLEASRRRLGTHVDVLMLHDPPDKILAMGAFAKAMAILVSRGTIKAWGVSTSSMEGARIAMGMGAKVVCIPYNALQQDLLPAIAEDAVQFGANFLVRSPLSHGLLTDQGVERKAFGADDHRGRRWTESALTVRSTQARGLGAVWVQKTRSLTEFALRFALTPPLVASAIVGPRTPAQVRELVEAVRTVERLDDALIDKTVQIAAALGI